MEEMHRNHKQAAWGWFAVVLALLDGFPRARSRPGVTRRVRSRVVTPWSQRSPHGWSA